MSTLDLMKKQREESIRRKVCEAIAEVVADPRCRASALGPEQSLLELGMDSLKLVDLAVALEDSLGLQEFPLQSWADAEAARNEPRFTIGSLLSTCGELVSQKECRNAG